MRRAYWVAICSLVLAGVFLAGLHVYLYASGTLAAWNKYNRTVWGFHVRINQASWVSANPDTLQVVVSFISNPGRRAVFHNVDVRDAAGTVIAEGEADPNSVLEGTTTTLTITLRDYLPPGEYTVGLFTEEGGRIGIHRFTKP